MKKLMLLPLLLGLATCEPSYALGRKAPVAVASPTPAPSASPSPVAVQWPAGVPFVAIGLIKGATPAEVTMIHEGVALANTALAGPCMKQWVLAAKYTENEGLTQQGIWDRLVAHRGIVDVEMYTGTWKQNHVSKTVGWEADPFDGIVHINRYFVKTASGVADNLVHEHKGHSPGFHHYGVMSTSQPYGMNYAYEGCTEGVQRMQRKGGKAYRPPGLRLEVRRATPRAKLPHARQKKRKAH